VTKHPNAPLFEKLYADFAQGNWTSVLSACPELVTFQVPGKSRLAGKFTKQNFAQEYGVKLNELSGGTFQMEVHDILVSDRHATILTTNRVTRGGKTLELRTVHVWRIEDGKPIAGYEYPRDLYLFDSTWA
jgi:ketosteroid isomerase-like protein